jgi:hypothetical protein
MLPRWTALTAAVTRVSAFAVPARLQPDTAATNRRDETIARPEREDADICTIDLSRTGDEGPGSLQEERLRKLAKLRERAPLTRRLEKGEVEGERDRQKKTLQA